MSSSLPQEEITLVVLSGRVSVVHRTFAHLDLVTGFCDFYSFSARILCFMVRVVNLDLVVSFLFCSRTQSLNKKWQQATTFTLPASSHPPPLAS